MAFTSVDDFQTALNACVSVRDWETLTESIQIPEVMVPMAYARLKISPMLDLRILIWVYAY